MALHDNPHVRFVTLAVGAPYRAAARVLVKSLRHCEFLWSMDMYADDPEPVEGACVIHCDFPADGFSKLKALKRTLLHSVPKDLYVWVDADMEIVEPLTAAELDPNCDAGLFCVRHFLPVSEGLWNVSPDCAAWLPPSQRQNTYWQTCFFGGYWFEIRGLVEKVNCLVHHSSKHEGAWEEPYFNRVFCESAAAGRVIRSLGCEFATPVWRPGQPGSWRQIHKSACRGASPRIFHANLSKRGG
jgi:hypothetical protein